MKKITYLIIFILMFASAYAIDECKGTIDQDEVPCGVYLPNQNSVTACNTIQVRFFNESTLLYTQTMSALNGFTCNATFNQSSLGTYTFNYTTGDSGSIVVEEGFNMILLMYFGIIAAIALMAFGLLGKDGTFASIGAILLIIMGFFILLNGFGNFDNLVTRTLAISFWGIGFYVWYRVNIEALDE